ncbi:MAG: tRNA preQ1(34) S-adenosylmethionine ribosyltransferase-isomerase QueA [candidate division Zixibacteria bacterium]|nr:tRNA preQ1(34) S-adenosylmethionine ribosyltransferase-isomerase QueA [candidate division Zixibacteria bacterium]
MNIELFDYELPRELIAQFPARRRDQSRLMILNRDDDKISRICSFGNITDYLHCGDALVVNNTKVFKARLFGHRKTGARVEVFLIRTVGDDKLAWYAFVSPSRRVKVGETVLFDVLGLLLEQDVGGGRWIVRFGSLSQREKIISRYGHVPLPHYIKRDDIPGDLRRYQTLFADQSKIGAVAAPTAGFHFTRPLLGSLKEKGVRLVELTLHVGPGTFKPVSVDKIEDHVVDPEFAELTPESTTILNEVRREGGRVMAVGTTSVRTLESAPIVDGVIQPFSEMVDLYIRPGYDFKVVDHLITNFHLPKSSLLILVSALAGRQRIIEAYHEAIRQRMRFYSYGDAMLIL